MLKLQLKCEVHPRYDPARGGEGAIRGACQRCAGLYDLFRYYLKVKRSYWGDESE